MKWTTFFGVAILLLLTGVAQAQGPRNRPARYEPYRPVISPYLFLSRPSVGGVPSYYAWVKPQFDLAQRQQYVDRQFQAIDRQLLRAQQMGAGVPSRGGTFLDYSHFYPAANSGSSAFGQQPQQQQLQLQR
jgi:hypothetical protein